MALDVHQLDHILLVGTGVLLLAILAVRLSVGVGLPSLLVYLLMGVVLGESGLGLHFDDAEVAHALGFAALILILAEGGLTTPWHEIRPVMRLGRLAGHDRCRRERARMALFGHFVLGLRWRSPCCWARSPHRPMRRRFSVLRRVPLPRRLTGVLEANRDSTTPPHRAGHPGQRRRQSRDRLLRRDHRLRAVAGTIGGLVVGYAGVWLLRRSALPSSGLYPLAVPPSLCWPARARHCCTGRASPRCTSPH